MVISTGRILVVDDRDNWRNEIVLMLQDEGYEVVAADSYAAAIQILQEVPYHLAVIDVRLIDADPANTDGLRLIDAIEENHWPTAVIVVTGYGRAKYEPNPVLKSPRVKAFLGKREFDNNQFLNLVAESVVASNAP
jgi:DNA-binding NtrC family response regulator